MRAFAALPGGAVDPGIVTLVTSASRQLRGMRPCSEGSEERTTHLVIGAERRTLKLLLAIVNGAWLLSPQWVTASLEAGRWLPEEGFLAQVGCYRAARRWGQALAGAGVLAADAALQALPSPGDWKGPAARRIPALPSICRAAAERAAAAPNLRLLRLGRVWLAPAAQRALECRQCPLTNRSGLRLAGALCAGSAKGPRG
jgi:BRCA1 C Terminus (BRCT) domain